MSRVDQAEERETPPLEQRKDAAAVESVEHRVESEEPRKRRAGVKEKKGSKNARRQDSGHGSRQLKPGDLGSEKRGIPKRPDGTNLERDTRPGMALQKFRDHKAPQPVSSRTPTKKNMKTKD